MEPVGLARLRPVRKTVVFGFVLVQETTYFAHWAAASKTRCSSYTFNIILNCASKYVAGKLEAKKIIAPPAILSSVSYNESEMRLMLITGHLLADASRSDGSPACSASPTASTAAACLGPSGHEGPPPWWPRPSTPPSASAPQGMGYICHIQIAVIGMETENQGSN